VIRRAAYAALLWAALPLVLGRLWLRGRVEPGYRLHPGERFGFYRRARTAGDRPLVWLHAVSLGETRALQPLFTRLQRQLPDCDFLVTHMTATGRQAAQELFAAKAELAWLPYDYPFALRRFLRRFRPALGILVETEVWFNVVHLCREEAVPLLLANARMSERSARGYRALGALARDAFAGLALVAAQTEADAERLRSLGAKDVRVVGNIKFDVAPRDELERLAAEFRSRYGGRKVFLAASTREGEEALLLDALSARPLGSALIVMVPRHPQRFDEVSGLLKARGLRFLRRSDNAVMPPNVQFLLGDSLGEMHAYYRAADVAFVGGSLLPYGGQNLIEACAAGVPVVVGPHTYNFAQAADASVAEGAALRAADAHEVVRVTDELLSDDSRRSAMVAAGRAFSERHRGAADRIAGLATTLFRTNRSRAGR
jgi:3-deoxy-D-manno-octulosonic-acid transferase